MEVKQQLSSSNVRECFFQAVSNSSWANIGYLVTAEIIGSSTLNELRILSGLHGIGLIRFDRNSPAQSEVLLPARERPNIDWSSVNRIAEQNKDFMAYIKLVKNFYKVGEVINTADAQWDTMLELDSP